MAQSFRGALAVLSLGVASVLGAAGCGGRTDGTEGICDSLTGCGGDLTGAWDVTSVCTRVVDGPALMTNLPACDATIRHAVDTTTASMTNATVQFSDGAYSQSGTMTTATTYVFTDSCLNARGFDLSSADTCAALQSTLLATGSSAADQTVFSYVHCYADAGACVCDVSGDTPFTRTGTYQTVGTQVLFDGDPGTAGGNDYCVKDGRGVITVLSNGVRTRYALKRH